MKRSVLILIIIWLISSLVAAEHPDREKDEGSGTILKPGAQGPDIGYAIMNKGELLNCYMNFGQITDSYFQTEFFDFMWPKSKGAIASDDNAVDDFSFLFARKGNVIDGYTAYRQEDWSPVPGSWGYYHAKDQPEELKHQGYPHLAVSDVPETWPTGYFDDQGNWVETPGEHHWPGDFRLDINPQSPNYGQPVPGEFSADRVTFSMLDDHTNLQHPPLGIQLRVQNFEYGRPYAADFHFYEVTITNTTDSTLDSCWWGYYMDIDYGEYEDEAYFTYSTGLNPGPWDVIYELDPEITDPNEFERGVFGVAFLKTPKDMGITDTHYFLDTGPTSDEQLFPIITSNPNDPNIAPMRNDFFHGSDVRMDDYTLTQGAMGFDWVNIVATGPFDLAPGESVKSVIVVCGGENVDDFKANIEMAKSMYLKNYQGPSGPKPPKLYAVPGDMKVTLYWTDDPEHVADPFTGEYDFEGYKIYRSTDDGQTWGEPIYDGSGGLVGYLPIATFDLKDNIMGLDPLNANFYLGNDSGIRHSFVDTDVKNGIIYTYTITAYDKGDPANNIQAFESSKGSKETEDNFVKVMPQPRPLGFVPPEASYEHTEGHGKGSLDIRIVDPDALTDHVYRITFPDSPGVHFDVSDATTGEVKLTNYPINTDEMPVVDGFSVRVNGDEENGGIVSITDEFGRNVWGAEHTDTTGSWYVEGISKWGNFDAKTSDYEIRFTARGSKVGTRLSPTVTVTETVPFEVWNVTYNQEVTAIVLDDGDLEYDEDEPIYIVNVPYPDVEIGETYSLNIIDEVPYQITVKNAPQDSLNKPPIEGQLVHVTTRRTHTPSDVYTLRFNGYSYRSVSESELSEIRVVPNPYVVNAAWERAKNVRRIEFMYLPPRCTIYIYTLRGELVNVLEHDSDSGTLDWNLTSRSKQDLAFGVYVYVVKTPDGKQHVGKFALIK